MVEFVNDPNFKDLVVDTTIDNRNDEEPMTIRNFTELMIQFYKLGWMRGSGGAMGCISGSELMISPSALQKERIREQDVFVYNMKDKTEVQRPPNKRITVSSCSVLFSLIMKETGSECVIHTHSKCANLITQLIKSNVFEISHQEYIKGIYDPFSGKALKYSDTLTIPIIDNMPSESQLLEPIRGVLENYPQAIAVLVRNHGLFVWGPTWESTKIMTECIDYLLELSIEMLKNNIPLVNEEAFEKEDNLSDKMRTLMFGDMAPV
ncbi:putative methylthioribulose-1-phosphate dehydratase [Caenorhabditis elegans]|uniref:Probable methylthioribulose-1-phosphate dehydratase n=1 Tax=Caenorhabditis elegans TaxID=6239 RepID=MTNB_CAEEL|nr:putative methylthioribulose-1-phosphate dehydratase [Caenorhabditis elegans]Q23261.2 RecName: Full=Probable methylthioribulose-1-phosphate dehydratase; Short=MTRu-1-P dehydratase [Caenorhabditis elegans]CAA88977.2 Probable methylthioribulose-1-phosphate dehydratase [Caenorhabditis elegans]|eukprot:NP_509690.2 Probable methylthioribulose-1-phosphate dehydratase [Caenorhabditis elegans]